MFLRRVHIGEGGGTDSGRRLYFVEDYFQKSQRAAPAYGELLGYLELSSHLPVVLRG
jgi:hypothetical protein